MLDFLLNLNPLLYAIVISFLPIAELRVGIPVAVASGVPLFWAFFWCTLANIIVTPIAFLFLETLHKWLIRIKFYKKIFNKTVARVRNKAQKPIDKYGAIGLAIFVAIPLPGTGAWAGSLAAWIFGLDRKKSFLAISLGVIIAGILVALATAGALNGISWMLKA